MAINRDQLIKEINQLLSEIELKQPEYESLEWYLKNNLGDYLREVEKSDMPNDLKIATKILSRFCLESMDWDTPLFKRCAQITELGLKIAKNG